MIYLQLFLSFLKIGAFSFGGGYAAMPMIQQQVVDAYHWLSVSEFGDLVTISQMTPGPIAINAATFVGIRVVGWQGALCATMGCVFPACVIVTVIAYFYVKYRHMEGLQMVLNTLRPAVIALILTSGITILTQAFFQESHIDLQQIKKPQMTPGKHASQHSTLQAKLSAMAQGTELILAAGSYLELPTLEKTHMSVFNRILNYWPKTKKQR